MERVRAGCEAPLVERHQEADGPGARVLPQGRRPRALALHKARHVAVKVELGAVVSVEAAAIQCVLQPHGHPDGPTHKRCSEAPRRRIEWKR